MAAIELLTRHCSSSNMSFAMKLNPGNIFSLPVLTILVLECSLSHFDQGSLTVQYISSLYKSCSVQVISFSDSYLIHLTSQQVKLWYRNRNVILAFLDAQASQGIASSITHSLTQSVPGNIKPSDSIKWASLCFSMVPSGIQWYPTVHNGTKWY